MKRICHVNVLSILINDKRFTKITSKYVFDYKLFTKLPSIIVARDFSPISFKRKRGIYFPWQNKYSGLRNIFHIKSKFFLAK